MRPSLFKIAILIGATAAIARAVMNASTPAGNTGARVRRSRGPGSLTTASDAIDDIELGDDPHPEQILDAGVMETFPASDPVSVNNAYESAYEKEQRRKRAM
jgi:hypothetical protein